MFMYDVKGTAQPAPLGEAQLNKSTQYVWGESTTQAQRVGSFHAPLN